MTGEAVEGEKGLGVTGLAEVAETGEDAEGCRLGQT